jgi:hypothetical protein
MMMMMVVSVLYRNLPIGKRLGQCVWWRRLGVGRERVDVENPGW